MTKTPRAIKQLSNQKLLTERRLMKTGRYDNSKWGNKTWAQHLETEIKRRKEAGTMKRSANYQKKKTGFGNFLL